MEQISRRSLLRLRTGRADVDYEGATARVRSAWEREGHEPLLRALEPAAGALASVAAVEPGQRVLDAGAGDGNVAAAALGLGAEVDACDLSPAMVERGRARVPAARWAVADVQALPYADGEFDAVLSGFGAALAPRARRTAAELARVVRPGGVVALTAWVPRGLPGRLDELAERPDGVRAPSDWGVPEVAGRRLDPHLEGLQVRTRTLPLAFETADALVEALLRPLDADPGAARPRVRRLVARYADAGAGVQVAGRYLLAYGRRR